MRKDVRRLGVFAIVTGLDLEARLRELRPKPDVDAAESMGAVDFLTFLRPSFLSSAERFLFFQPVREERYVRNIGPRGSGPVWLR